MVDLPLKAYPVTTTKPTGTSLSGSDFAQPYTELANTLKETGAAAEAGAVALAEPAGLQAVTRDADGNIQVDRVPFVGAAASHYEHGVKMGALAAGEGDARRADIKLRSEHRDDPQGYLAAAETFTNDLEKKWTSAVGPEVGIALRRSVDQVTTQTYKGLLNEKENRDLKIADTQMTVGIQSATDDLMALARGGVTSGPAWDAAMAKRDALTEQRVNNPRLAYPREQADYDKQHLAGQLAGEGFVYHVDSVYKNAPTKAEGAQQALDYAKGILTNPDLKLTQPQREALYHKAVGEVRANEALRKQDISEARQAATHLTTASALGATIQPSEIDAVAQMHIDAGDQAGAARLYATFARKPLNDDFGRQPIADQTAQLNGTRGQAAAKMAFDFFKSRGYSDAQSSGIVGNLIHESGLDPALSHDAGTGIGIAGFRNERKASLEQFARERGTSSTDYRTQLEFIDKELRSTEGATFQKLSAAQTPEDAAAAFINYERPQGWTPDNPSGGLGFQSRVALSRKVFTGQGNVDTSTPASALWLSANRAASLDTAARAQWKQVWDDYKKEGIRPSDKVVNDLLGAARAVGDHDLLETIGAAGDQLEIARQGARAPLPEQKAQITEFHRLGGEQGLTPGQAGVLKDLEKRYTAIDTGLKESPISTTVANFGDKFKTPPPLNPADAGQFAAGIAYRGKIAQFAAQNYGVTPRSVIDHSEAGVVNAALTQSDPALAPKFLSAMDVLPPENWRATIASPVMKTALDGMVRSYEPTRLNAAMGTLDKYWRQDPIGFKEAFGEDTLKRLQVWQTWRDSASPAEIAERFKRSDDPALHGAREALLGQANEEVKAWKPQDVANAMGTSFAITPGPVARLIGSDPYAPADSVQGAQLQWEFENAYRDLREMGAPADQAKKQAAARMGTVWGQSKVGGGTLMRYPPERYYPQVNGSHDWIKGDIEKLIADTKGAASGPEAEAGALRYGTLHRENRYALKTLVSDGQTEAEIQAKKPPSYAVVVTDRYTGQDEVLTDKVGNHRFSFDARDLQEQERAKFTAAHDAMQSEAAKNRAALARGMHGEIKGPLGFFFGGQ